MYLVNVSIVNINNKSTFNLLSSRNETPLILLHYLCHMQSANISRSTSDYTKKEWS